MSGVTSTPHGGSTAEFHPGRPPPTSDHGAAEEQWALTQELIKKIAVYHPLPTKQFFNGRSTLSHWLSSTIPPLQQFSSPFPQLESSSMDRGAAVTSLRCQHLHTIVVEEDKLSGHGYPKPHRVRSFIITFRLLLLFELSWMTFSPSRSWRSHSNRRATRSYWYPFPNSTYPPYPNHNYWFSQPLRRFDSKTIPLSTDYGMNWRIMPLRFIYVTMIIECPRKEASPK